MRFGIRSLGMQVLAMVLLCCAGLSQAQDPATIAAPTPATKVVMPFADFYPYSFAGPQGEARGYNIDALQLLLEGSGYTTEFVHVPSPTHFFAMLAAGEVDVTPFLGLTPERMSKGLATRPIGHYVVSAFTRVDHHVSDISGLAGLRVGVVEGSISLAAADRIASPDVVTFQSTDDLILPLLRGELDAVVSVANIFEEALRRAYIDDKIIRMDMPILSIPYGIIVRPDRPELQRLLNAGITKQLPSPQWAELKKFWFGADLSVVDHPWFPIITFGVSLVALVMGVLLILMRKLHHRSGRLLAENGANKLLIQALNNVRAAITIFDQDMKAVHSNVAGQIQFTDLMQDLMTSNSRAGGNSAEFGEGISPSPEELQSFTVLVEEGLRSGKDMSHIMYSQDGHVYDVQLFPLDSQHFATMQVDVSQIHKQKQTIADQRAELERQNDQLNAFTAIAAHDLRAPLLRQKALLEFALHDMDAAQIALPQDISDLFDQIADQADRMSALVADLLRYARAETAMSAPEVISPIERLSEITPLIAVKKGFQIAISGELPEIWVDPAAFDMVMRNLISNAVKHHDRDAGTIKIRAAGAGADDQVMIEVEDDGPGIAADKRDEVFEPFRKLHNSASTGLGLSFVKKSVEAWGGQISHHPAPNGGSIFRLSLPRAPVPLDRPACGVETTQVPAS